MDRIVYDRMAEHDSTHWWYTARRDVLHDYIARYADLPKDARVLEIGCGTGHNLPMLQQFGTVAAIEIDPAARALASKRLGKPVGAARVGGRLTGRDDSDDSPPPGPVNKLFEATFRAERHLVGRVPMPIGVSILTLAVPKS